MAVSQTGDLNNKFIVSQFWSLVVQNPGYGSSAGKEVPVVQETLIPGLGILEKV